MLYRYVKEKKRQKGTVFSLPYPKRFPFTSTLLMVVGVSIIIWVLWPIVSFELFFVPRDVSLIRPIPDEVVVQAFENQFSHILGLTTVDYTKASNWLPKSPPRVITDSKITSYTVSIPKLKIDQAEAIIGGDDLKRALIHYGGTALPGTYGKAVIFGHSVLPVFFNPKNYLTIFSTLPKLDKGDEIFVTYDNITYKYIVDNMRVVSPDDVSVLEQRYDWPTLCLVTCVPPGTYFKRLNVCAKLEKLI